MGRHGPIRWLALGWLVCGTGRREETGACVEEVGDRAWWDKRSRWDTCSRRLQVDFTEI